MRKFRDIIFGCILAGSISTCTDLNFAGGGLDTETSGGTVVGLLAAEDGTPEINAQVFCVPSSYNALKDPQLSDTLINTTDETGCYRFDGVKKGTYNIQAVSPEKKTNILICGIDVGKDTVMVPGGTLHASGTLKIIFPDAGYDAPSYCYLPGTTFFAQIQNGLAVMNDVPAGFVPAADYFNTLDSTKNHVIQAGLFISLGDTTVIADLTAWRYSKKLYLNTTAAGANINGNVFNFPALVRLTPNNFDFTQAAAGGGDIRFAKSDNTPLTYEIERWDAGARVAEIWVKVDTIYGNDSVQSITMYWGNQNASDNSNGPVVFDTAEGFQGVWHLAQPNGSVIPDATGNGNDGTATGTTTGAGEVGMAQMFNGKSSFIRVSGPAMDKLNFPENGAFSVAAWVQTNVLDSLFHGVVYKSNEQYGLQMRPKNIWEFCTYIDNTRWELSRAFAMDYSWHALVGVRNGTKQYLYVDGVCADTSVALLSSNLARVTDQPLDIGHCPDGGTDPDRYFNGAIDEVRIASVVRSADWIKLCFMNQKVPDALVKW